MTAVAAGTHPASLGDGQSPRRDWGGDHDGRDGLTVDEEAIEGFFDVPDRGGVHFDQEAIFAAYAVAFGDLGCLLC
jgi:hypothetical protein